MRIHFDNTDSSNSTAFTFDDEDQTDAKESCIWMMNWLNEWNIDHQKFRLRGCDQPTLIVNRPDTYDRGMEETNKAQEVDVKVSQKQSQPSLDDVDDETVVPKDDAVVDDETADAEDVNGDDINKVVVDTKNSTKDSKDLKKKKKKTKVSE